MGDFNLNLTNYNKRGTYNFLEQLFNHVTPQITRLTTVIEKTTTLIDIIFVNNLLFKYISNTTISVSDHLLQFIVVENFKESKITSKIIGTNDMDFQFFIKNNDVNLGFETF